MPRCWPPQAIQDVVVSTARCGSHHVRIVSAERDRVSANDCRLSHDAAQHVVHYGSSVFDGIRCHAPNGSPTIFRADDHIQRLLDSAKIYRMDVGYTRDELVHAMIDLIGKNGVWPCYVRPVIFRGYGDAG